MGQVEKLGRILGEHEGVVIVQSVGPLVMASPSRAKAVEVSERLRAKQKPGVALDPVELAAVISASPDLRGDILVEMEQVKRAFPAARLERVREGDEVIR